MSHSLAPHLIGRTGPSRRKGADLTFLDDLTLTRARVHELCGSARRTLALVIAQALDGPVIWITPDWNSARLHAEGVVSFLGPERLLFVNPRREEDLLWSMEEALRAGVIPCVVADLPKPPALTPVRRLHLAAETGASEGTTLPLGLILTPSGAAPGVESRWSLSARHPDTFTRRWKLGRLRARTAPEAEWDVTTIQKKDQKHITLTCRDRSAHQGNTQVSDAYIGAS